MNIGANINPDDFAWGEEGLDNIITQVHTTFFLNHEIDFLALKIKKKSV